MKKILIWLAILAGVMTSGVASASLYDYYASQGQNLPSVSDRALEYSNISNEVYTGSYEQNIALEQYLNGGELLGSIARPEMFYSENLTRSLALGGSETEIYVSTLPNETTGYLVINPNSASTRELIKYTGVTTTSGNHLTGVTRGLAEYGTTGVAISDARVAANCKKHSSGESIIMSNGRYEQLIIDQLNGLTTTSIKGTDYNGFVFDYFPIVNNTGYTSLPTQNGQLATKYYVDNVGAGGFTSLNASTTKGLEVYGTAPETVGVNVYEAKGMTIDATNGLYAIASTTKNLNQDSSGIYLEGNDDFTWTGGQTFSSGTIFNGNITSNGTATFATTTVSTSTITSLTLGGENANTLINDSNADALHIHNYNELFTASTTSLTGTLSGETTILSVTTTGGILGTSNIIKLRAFTEIVQTSNVGPLVFKLKYGGSIIGTITTSGNVGGSTYKGIIEGVVYAAGSTSAQEGSIFVSIGDVAATPINYIFHGVGNSTVDSTTDKSLVITVQKTSGDQTSSYTIVNYYIEVLK